MVSNDVASATDSRDAASAAGRGATLAASALLFAVILILYVRPFWGNELIYLPAAWHFSHPDYLLNDWTFAGSGNAHWVFNAVVGGMMTVLSMEAVGWIGRLIVWALLADGLVRLGRAFGLPPMTAALAVIIWLVAGQSVVGSEWMFPSFEAKTVAYVLLVYALAGALEGRLLVPAILAGLCFSVHPSVGLQGGFALGVMVLAAGDWRRTLRFTAIAAICALPGLIPILPLLGETTSSGGQWHFLSVVLMPAHLNPLLPEVRDQVLLAYGFLAFTWLHIRTRQGDTPARSLLIFEIALAVIFTGGLLARVAERWELLQIFPFRVYPLFATLFFFMALLSAFRQWRTVRPPLALAVAGLVLLLWLPNPARLMVRNVTYCRVENEGGYCQAWGHAPDDLGRVFEWMSSNTPRGSVAILPPWRKDAWYRSERAQVASWHHVPYGMVGEWRERIESMLGRLNDTNRGQGNPSWMKARYLEMSPARVETILRNYGAGYLVSSTDYDWPVAYDSGDWKVYVVRSEK